MERLDRPVTRRGSGDRVDVDRHLRRFTCRRATDSRVLERSNRRAKRMWRLDLNPMSNGETNDVLGVDVPVTDQEDPDAGTATEFLWLLLIPAITGIVFLAIFAVLRKKDSYYKRVYAPRLLEEEKTGDIRGPAAIDFLPKDLFKAVRKFLPYGEDDVLKHRGADMCVVLKLQKFIMKVSALFAFFGWAVIVPINLTGGGVLPPASDQWYNKLSMSKVQEESHRFWAHLVMCYLFTLLSFKLLLDTTKRVMEARVKHVLRENPGIEAYSVMVTDMPLQPTSDANEGSSSARLSLNISVAKSAMLGNAAAASTALKNTVFPKHSIRKEDVEAFFNKEYPGEVHTVSCIPAHVADVQALWIRYNKNVEKLKRAELDYEIGDGQGAILFKQDAPKLDPSKKKQAAKLEHIRERFEHYKLKTIQLKKDLVELQAEALERPVVAAIVTLRTMRAAATAGQVLHTQDGTLWLVGPALEPGAIYWENMGIRKWTRNGRSIGVAILHVCLIFLWMIPVFFVSSLTTLSNLEKWLPFVADLPEWFRGFLQGFLPGLALILFNMLLPPLCRWLTSLEGVQTMLDLDNGMSSKLFGFQVFNTFLGITVMASLLSEIEEIVDGKIDFMEVVELLGDAVPTTAMFFLNYILLKTWAGSPQDMARLVDIVIMHIKERFLCRTIEEKESAGKAKPPSYGALIPSIMFVLLVSVVFSIINPLVTPFALLGMAVVYIVTLHHFLFVCSKNSYESGGMLWLSMVRQIMWIFFLMHLTLAGVFLLKKVPIIAALTIPLWFVSYAFYAYCMDKFGKPMQFAPLQSVCALEQVEPKGSKGDMLRLERLEQETLNAAHLSQFEKTAYAIPCLQPPAELEHEVQKVDESQAATSTHSSSHSHSEVDGAPWNR